LPTPPKPANVIKLEKKSHRTNAELLERERAEKSLLTGEILKESKDVRKNELAHKEFLRIKKLLKKVDKDDDLYGSTINRYCLLLAECTEFQVKREKMYEQMCDLEESKESFCKNDDLETYFRLQSSMQKNMISLDKQVQTKRKMLLDIEKENIMTIASSLRSIPKKQENKKSALLKALGG
jgi:hypothetical protein